MRAGGAVSGSSAARTRSSAIQLTSDAPEAPLAARDEMGYAMNFWSAWPAHTMDAPVR